MHVFSVKIWRRLLIALMLVVVVAVILNYFQSWRNRMLPVKQVARMLASDMMRSADSIEYSQHEKGSLRFKIRADKLLETRKGKNLLQGIESFDFNTDGSIRDEIRSRNAEYDASLKSVTFANDVRLKMAGGSELRTDSLHYDLNSNIGNTEDKLQFETRQMTGEATGLRYDHASQTIELMSAATFKILRRVSAPDGSSRMEVLDIKSEQLIYSDRDQIALFRKEARLKWGDSILSADQIEAHLSSGKREVKSLMSSGNVIYQAESAGEMQTMRGDSLVFDINEENGSLKTVTVRGHATFLTSNQQGEFSLQGAMIEISVDSVKGSPTALNSQSDVVLKMRHDAEEARVTGDWLEAHFRQPGGNMERMHVRGGAVLERTSLSGKGSDTLRGDDLQVRFRDAAGSNLIHDLDAAGSVKWTSKTSGNGPTSRRLAASSLNIAYAEAGDYLEHGNAAGNVSILDALSEQAEEAGARQMRADTVRFQFYPGANQLKELTGDGNVHLNYRKSGLSPVRSDNQEFQTSSAKIKVTFLESDGTTDAISQWGGCSLHDGVRIGRAGRCDYDASTQKLILREAPKIEDVNYSTTGEQIEYDRSLGVVKARRNVRSVMAGKNGKGTTPFVASSGSHAPTVVTADEMQYWPALDRARYEKNVEILSESGQLQAEVVEILDGGGRVEAQGKVQHLIARKDDTAGDGRRGPDMAGSKQVRPSITSITSASLHYSGAQKSISYVGGVEMHSEDVFVSSKNMDAWWDDAARQIERARAEGNVIIVQGARQVRGDSADYSVSEGRFVVQGNLAQLNDSIRGKSAARRLTFHIADDRILLENRLAN